MGQCDPRSVEQRILECVRSDADALAAPTPSLTSDLGLPFVAHRDRIYATCYHFLGEPEQANELARDTQ